MIENKNEQEVTQPPITPRKAFTVHNLLAAVPVIATTIATASFVFSVIYNIGYFQTLPGGLYELLTFNDYLAGAVYVAGYVVYAFAALGALLGLLVRAFADKILSYSGRQITNERNFLITLIMSFLAGYFVTIAARQAMAHQWMEAASFGALSLSVLGFLSIRRILPNVDFRAKYAFWFFVCAAIVADVRGRITAVGDLKRTEPTLQMNEGKDTRKAVLLRSLEKVVVLHFLDTATIEVVEWQEFKRASVSALGKPSKDQGIPSTASEKPASWSWCFPTFRSCP